MKNLELQPEGRIDYPPPIRYVAELLRIPRAERSLALRYGFAGAATFASLLLTLATWPVSQFNPLLIPFASVIVSAWYGGLGPGLSAAVLSAFIGAELFDRTLASPQLVILSALLQVGVFALTSTLISMRFGTLHEAFAQLSEERARRDDAERNMDLLEKEAQSVRDELRNVHERFGFIASTGELLTSTLNYQTVLEGLGRQAVSGLAVWCMVDMYGVGNEVHRLVVSHRDKEKQKVADQLYPFPPDPRSNHPVARVLYSGQPELIADADQMQGLLANLQEEERKVIEELGLASYIVVPLVSRGKILGAITLVSTDPSLPYRPGDLTLAQDLAYRAALAIDNARLYRAAQDELADRRQSQMMLSRQQARINALNARLQRAMTETHHRVKNNLQIVAAMIELRLFDAGDTVPAEELRRLASYVLTLSAVHDILTQQAKTDAEAERVSARAVLEKLLDLMHRTTASAEMSWSIDDAVISVRKGTSLALLANELVSNAVKHGLGKVEVQFRVQKGSAILTVQDNGPGFPADFDALLAANTGLELVESLSRSDLEGEISYTTARKGGGLVTVTFPLQGEE